MVAPPLGERRRAHPDPGQTGRLAFQCADWDGHIGRDRAV
jgi:hypothetical protein